MNRRESESSVETPDKCSLESAKYIPKVEDGDDAWSQVPEHLYLGFGVMFCVSLPLYCLCLCFQNRGSSSSLISPPPSLMSLVSGRQDKWLKEEKGKAALHYFIFQRMLLFLSLISLVVSAVSLLINILSGHQGSNYPNFFNTTISNLAAVSKFHWYNVMVSFLLPWLVVVVVNRFMVVLYKIPPPSQEETNTLVIEGLDQTTFSDFAIVDYFSFTYPRFQLKKITRAKDTRLLRRHLGRLEWNTAVIEHLLSLEDPMEDKTCCGKEWSLAAFGRKQLKLSLKIEAEQMKLKNNSGSVRITFPTFASSNQAQKIVMMEQMDPFSNYCTIEQAPWPEDIAWENIRSPVLSMFIIAFSCFTLLLVSFIAASPTALHKIFIREGKLILGDEYDNVKYLPVLVLLGFSLLMPYLVKLSLVRFGHWSRIKMINNYMVGLFFWLLLTTVFFPAFMLLNAGQVTEFIKSFGFIGNFSTGQANDIFQLRLQCLNVSSTGAFFVNYLVLSALIKTQVHLHRLGDWMYELWLVLVNSCSRAERRVASIYAKDYCRKRNTGDNVSLSQDYVSCTVYFAVMMCYSTVCPMVSPAFVLFIIVKHIVDLQNMRVCYSAKVPEPLLIRTAAQLVIFCPLLGQVATTVYHLNNQKEEEMKEMGLVAGSLLLLNLFLLMVLQSTGWKFPVSVFRTKDNVMKSRKKRVGRLEEEYVDPVLSGGYCID